MCCHALKRSSILLNMSRKLMGDHDGKTHTQTRLNIVNPQWKLTVPVWQQQKYDSYIFVEVSNSSKL